MYLLAVAAARGLDFSVFILISISESAPGTCHLKVPFVSWNKS